MHTPHPSQLHPAPSQFPQHPPHLPQFPPAPSPPPPVTPSALPTPPNCPPAPHLPQPLPQLLLLPAQCPQLCPQPLAAPLRRPARPLQAQPLGLHVPPASLQLPQPGPQPLQRPRRLPGSLPLFLQPRQGPAQLSLIPGQAGRQLAAPCQGLPQLGCLRPRLPQRCLQLRAAALRLPGPRLAARGWGRGGGPREDAQRGLGLWMSPGSV